MDVYSEGRQRLRAAGEGCVPTPASMTVFIPLSVRKRGGRAQIMPFSNMLPSNDHGVDPRVLKSIARGWSWCRRLESGEASTILDIAQGEGVTDRFVSRMVRLAWLSPAVLEILLVQRQAPAVSIKDIIGGFALGEQKAAMLGN